MIDRLKINYPPVRGPLDGRLGRGSWTTPLQLDESHDVQSAGDAAHAVGAVWDFAEVAAMVEALSLAPDHSLTLYCCD
jgi:hypothetical protein